MSDQWAADRELIDNLLSVERGLSCKEIDFIESADKQLGADGYDEVGPNGSNLLTDKQWPWAEDVLERVSKWS